MRSGKEFLVAFTVPLMLYQGIIIDRRDYDQPHSHVESTGPTNRGNSGRVRVDSGATANDKTGTIGVLPGGGMLGFSIALEA